MEVWYANEGYWKAPNRTFIPYVVPTELKTRSGPLDLDWVFIGQGAATSKLINDVLTLSLDAPIAKNSRGTLVPFPDGCWLYDDISTAPLHPNSAQYVQAIVDDVTPHYSGIAAFNVNQYNSAFFAVFGSSLIKQNMGFDDCQNKGYLPSEFAPVLQQVPIPEHTKEAAGLDRNITIYNVETGDLWEFWKASKDSNGQWSACWGGKLNVNTASEATFTGNTGSTATGISQTALSISIDEARRRVINHCVGFVMINIQSGHVWPARRADGYLNDTSKPKEGTRFRLPQSFNLDSINLHPVAKAIAVAAKTHGMILFDKAGSVGVTAESGQRFVDAGLDNPWTGILDGTPTYRVMRNFPWGSLEAIADDYNRP